MSGALLTADLASLVYGGAVALDDPAESFHEASRLYPHVAPDALQSFLGLARSGELQQIVARAGKTYDHLAGLDLPEAGVGRVRLRDAFRARRSSPPGGGALTIGQLAAILGAVYRSRSGRRPVPSGGALFPLELYVVALDVSGLERAVYHYNAFRHRLERLRPVDGRDVEAVLLDPTHVAGTSACIAVTGMFWRSRFKYGLRGYRFALIEAGHAMQNALLAAAALRVPALPVGGFYDRGLDALVGADGVEEASLYALLVGGRA